MAGATSRVVNWRVYGACIYVCFCFFFCVLFFFQEEDGIRDLVRSRGLGDVYKRQHITGPAENYDAYLRKKGFIDACKKNDVSINKSFIVDGNYTCLLYTSDAADERSSVDLGGRRIIKKKNNV